MRAEWAWILLSMIVGFKKPFINLADAAFEIDARFPAKRANAADIEEFSRCAVGPVAVPLDFAFETDGVPHHFGQLLDGLIFADADINRRWIGEFFEQQKTSFGCIVHVKPFAPWRPGAPQSHRSRTRFFRLMKLINHSGQRVAGVRIEVVPRSVEISG